MENQIIQTLMPYIVAGFVINFLIALAISEIGEKREIGGGKAFVISLLFGPVIGLIAVLLSEEIPKEMRNKEITKKEPPTIEYEPEDPKAVVLETLKFSVIIGCFFALFYFATL